MKLVIGTRTYSSWSLRGWLAAEASGIPFDEVLIDLDGPDSAAAIRAYSPSGRVPVLIDGDVVVWDSLAIGEYLAEKAPAAGLWPADAAARAFARSIVAEMHAGFGALRAHMPMNIRRTPSPRPPDEVVAADVARICAIWREARGRFGAGGPYLLGDFTLADCAYAPVASRFVTYDVPLDDVCAAYVGAVSSHPAVAAWIAAARAETWVVAADEVD